MTVKVGVWIDHQKAVVVRISDQGEQIKRLKSDVPRRVRPVGSSSKKSYTPNDFVADDRIERKVASRLKEFYDEVIDCAHGAEEILIMGPGEAKGELRKRLESKKGRGVVAEVETVDKMTDRQITAKVRQHFFVGPPASRRRSPQRS